MGRRRQIHHQESLAAKFKADENTAACAPAEALEWPEGTYQIVRLPLADYREKTLAIAEVSRRHPGATIGKSFLVRGKWIVRIRPPKE